MYWILAEIKNIQELPSDYQNHIKFKYDIKESVLMFGMLRMSFSGILVICFMVPSQLF